MMENIEKIQSLKNIDISELSWDLFILVVSAGSVLLVFSYLKNLGLDLKPEGMVVIIWIFFTFALFLLLEFLISQMNKIIRVVPLDYSPSLLLQDLIYQGWLEIRNGKEIYLTNSNSGMLFKNLWLKNFKATFKFKFESLETNVIQGYFNNQIKNKIHKYNYLGILFRAQSLEDYFMLSIGILVNDDDYSSRVAEFGNEEELLKQGKFEVTITPHIKLNGKWEQLGGRSIGAFIKINEFTFAELRVRGDLVIIEMEGRSFYWNLPTNFDGAIAPQGGEIKNNQLINAESTKISFRRKRGMFGFRSFYAEHSIIKDIAITKI